MRTITCIEVRVERSNEDPAVRIYSVSKFTANRTDLLQKLQASVGGYVEAIPTSDDVTMWVNEEGKLINLPRNELAEVYWDTFDRYGCLPNGDWIAGTMVITGGTDAYGYTKPIGTKQMAYFESLLEELAERFL